MKSARRKATYEDLRNVPDPLVAEIIDGELVTTPRPAVPHALAASAIGSVLFGAFNGPPGGSSAPGGWWILSAPELHLGEDVLVPDLAGWRRTRIPTLPDAPALTDAPDWACEAVFPSTMRIDCGRRMRIYARERVGHFCGWSIRCRTHSRCIVSATTAGYSSRRTREAVAFASSRSQRSRSSAPQIPCQER